MVNVTFSVYLTLAAAVRSPPTCSQSQRVRENEREVTAGEERAPSTTTGVASSACVYELLLKKSHTGQWRSVTLCGGCWLWWDDPKGGDILS